MNDKLKGIMPAIASPCDENGVFQEDAFARLGEYLSGSGVNGFYVCGNTGDGLRMCVEDRKRAVEIIIEIAGKRGQSVIAQVGTSDSIADALALAEHSAEAGADAVSSLPPVGAKHEELVKYYSDIARASNLPVLVYHIPFRTGINATVEQMVELLDIEGVEGLKLTDWNFLFMKQLRLARPDIAIFNGFDEGLCPGLLYGASGGIGTNYNLFPKLFIGIYKAIQQLDIAKAMVLQNYLLPYADLLWKIGVDPLFEYLMQQRGFGPYCYRGQRDDSIIEAVKKVEPELNEYIAAIEEATK